MIPYPAQAGGSGFSQVVVYSNTFATRAPEWTFVSGAGISGGAMVVPSSPGKASINMVPYFGGMLRQYTFDIMADTSLGGLAIAELYFGCNSGGSGVICRLDCRGSQPSGFYTATAWNNNGGAITVGASQTVTANAFHTIHLIISGSNTASMYIDGVFYVTSASLTFNGLYFGNQPSFCQVKYRNMQIT